MACAGVDFGNKTCVVAIARRGGIDICCNEVSNRATPTIVSFQGGERHMGEAAASIAAQNHQNTVSSIQRLLGVSHKTQFAQEESKRLTCDVVPDPATGTCAAKVSYSGLDTHKPDEPFSMQAVMAMLLTNLMSTASGEYKAPVRDLVISVPVYYTETQRRAVLDAATIANFNILRVLNEHAAIALSYGIFRTKELPETTPLKVAFVDIGEASTTVSIAAFTNTRCDVLSVATDPSLGGRDLDDIIFNKFAKDFKTNYSIDVNSKPKAAARLRKECEKMKKMLSANPEAPLNLECLMNDVDVKGHFKREELEAIAAPLFARIRSVCEKAILDAKLKDGEKLAAVEIVGGSTRVPAFKNIVTEIFGKVGAPLRTTLNADECIARGCALMSAMLSPAFRVRDYILNDINVHSLDAEKIFTSGTPPESVTLVPKSNPIPCLKAMTFRSPGPLTVNVRYSNPEDLPYGEDDAQICSYLIDAPLDPDARVRTKIRVTVNGTVEVASAQLTKEVEVEEEVVVKKSASPNCTQAPNGTAAGNCCCTEGSAPDAVSTDEPSPDTEQKDTPMPDTENNTDAKEPTKEESSPATEGKPSESPAENDVAPPKEASSPVEPTTVPEKRLVKKMQSTDLHMTRLPIGGGLPANLVQEAVEKEAKMKANDLYIKERSEAMNSLEAYVYDMRSRIDEYGGDLKEFGTADLRSSLKVDLDATEEWLYSDEAETASKSSFVEKKTKLQAKGQPMLFRKKEWDERPVRVRVLVASIEAYKQVLVPDSEPYAHIPAEDKEKLQKCVEGAAIWLKQETVKQENLSKDVDPVLTCAALNSMLTEVDSVCKPIQNMPKPKPKEEEKVKKEDMMDDKGSAPETKEAEVPAGTENGNGKAAEGTPPNGDKMEVD